MSRWGFYLGERERYYKKAPIDPQDEVRAGLEQMLLQHMSTPIGPCVGWDPDAERLWEEWSTWLEAFIVENKRNQWMVGSLTRLNVLAIKWILLLYLDHGYALAQMGAPWTITRDLVQEAINLVELCRHSVLEVLDSLALTPFARTRRDVLERLATGPATVGDILRGLQRRISKRELLPVIETLVEEGTITTWGAGTGNYYVLAPAVALEISVRAARDAHDAQAAQESPV